MITVSVGVRYVDPTTGSGARNPGPGRHPYVYRRDKCVYEPVFICAGCGGWIELDEQGKRGNPCPLCGRKR